MHFRASANLFCRSRDRRAVAVLCLLLVCLFAGISATHQHSLNDSDSFVAGHSSVCEVCATALQAAVIVAVLLLLLHRVAAQVPRTPRQRPLVSFDQTTLFCRPPPFQT
jgi:hypothetical protein